MGWPLNWSDDVTGTLPAAVRAYLEGALTPEQFTYVCAYLVHHINAPCWLEKFPGPTPDLDYAMQIGALRKRAQALESVEDVAIYIHDALTLGIDPL